jgi:RNA polymerase sigma-70 factor (ECF subfamily)
MTVLGQNLTLETEQAPAGLPTVSSVQEEHDDFVWKSLQRLGVREPDLEDMAQEVFMVVHRRLHTFDGSAKMTTWLFGICSRVASSYRRSAYVRRERPVSDVPERAAGDEVLDPEEATSERQSRALLDRIIAELDVDKRAVFVMFEIDELSCDQIAAIVGVPLGTVYSRLHAARKAFEKALARYGARASGGGGG